MVEEIFDILWMCIHDQNKCLMPPGASKQNHCFENGALSYLVHRFGGIDEAIESDYLGFVLSSSCELHVY